MSEKVSSGLKSTGGTTTTTSSGMATAAVIAEGNLEAERAQAALDSAEAALSEAEAAVAAAVAAIGVPAAVPASLLLDLPLPFGNIVTAPEIALPVIAGSATVPEGDEETQEMFNALADMSAAQQAMGEAVFATLDPILQGLEDPILFTAADVAIVAGGITDDPPTQCPIPADDVIPSMARMQLFDEMLYALRRATMAGGTEDPEAPGKILCAYTCLAIEKFVRRAVIRVSLPDDKVIDLTSKLTDFGTNTAKKSDSGLQAGLYDFGTDDTGTAAGNAANGTYDLSSSDIMLGFDVVPMLTFYGGIDTLKDYGYNFDNGSGEYRSDDGDVPLVNLQAVLMSLKNGINFI